MRLPRPAAGAKVVLLVTDNHASKLALRMAKALLRPRDELRVTTVVMSPESLSYGRKLTEEFCSSDTSGQLIPEVGGTGGQQAVGAEQPRNTPAAACER
jgi:hypothetical protein